MANFRTGALMEKGFDTWPAMFDEAKNYLKDIAVYAVIMLYMRTKYLEQIAEVENEV